MAKQAAVVIRWQRSDEGVQESACRIFAVLPVFNHATRPQGYTACGPDGLRSGPFATMRDARVKCERWAATYAVDAILRALGGAR